MARAGREMARGATLRVPGGGAGLAALGLIDVPVPGRSEGRENWHREQHCAVALVRCLLAERPQHFPAILLRGETPDFVLSPETAAGRILAIEHTDMGTQSFQRILDAAAAQEVTCLIELSGPAGWVGDEAEQSWAGDLREAMARKSEARCWRTAPTGAARWLLVCDNAKTGIGVEDEEVRRLISTALRTCAAAAELDAIALVRNHRVMIAERGEGLE